MNSLKKSAQHKLSKRDLNVIRKVVTNAHGSYEPSLSKRALYKTNNAEMSQDLVQTTFLKTLMYLQKGGKIDTMRSFLNHVLNGLIIDEYRKNKPTSLDVLLQKGFEPNYDNREQSMDIIDGKQVALLIPSLPKKYREVMRMRYMHSLSLKEISLITGQSSNTIAVQAHRGLAKLKILYEEKYITNNTK